MADSQPGTIFGREPAMVLALVQAVIAPVLTFGLNLAPDQIGAILAVTAVILGLITRSRVSPARGRLPPWLAPAHANGPPGRRPRGIRRGRRFRSGRGGARRRPTEYRDAAPGRPAGEVGLGDRAADLSGAGGRLRSQSSQDDRIGRR